MKWTKEKCAEEALKYANRWTLRQKSGGCYMCARKNNWLDDICSHMVMVIKPQNYWTKEMCQVEALKYKNYSEFIKNCVTIYKKCIKNNWLNEICSHMSHDKNISKRCVYVYLFEDHSAYVGLTSNLKRRNTQHLNMPPVFILFNMIFCPASF